MTDIQTLAIRTAAKLDLTDESAESALETYIRQVEALESREIDRDDISDDDAAFLMESMVQAQRSGDLGQAQLAELEELMPEVQDAQDRLETMEQQRNTAIKAALGAGARVKDVAAASGLSRQRVEQIRAK